MAIFNPSLKLDQDVLALLLCPPARETYITFKIYLDYKVFFSFSVIRDPTLLTSQQHLTLQQNFSVETSDTETNARNTNAVRSPLHNKYFMLLQNCLEKGLLGAPATSPSGLVLSQPQDFKDFKQRRKADQS